MNKIKQQNLIWWIKREQKVQEFENKLRSYPWLSQSEIQGMVSEFRKAYKLRKWKWYEFIKFRYPLHEKKLEIEFRRKTPKEIGTPLENLVECALTTLGCTIISSRHTWLNSPCPFKEDGKFKNHGFIFKRYPRKKDMVDFEGQNIPIAIEVKNWDPVIPKSDKVVQHEICKRFKKVRKKDRYLLVPEASPFKGFPFTPKQRKILSDRGIKEINFKEQLRWNNQKEVYKSVFYALEQILSTH